MRRKTRLAIGRPSGLTRRDRARTPLAFTLETLERRSMLAGNVLDVTKVVWSGQQVDAVRNEYVLRMPQINAATARSPIDYACATPTVQAGWSVQPLGSGFYKLTAPGVTQGALTTWASRNGVQSIDVNRVAKASRTPDDVLYGDLANWAFPKIQADGAWNTGTGTSSTIAAVLDSGVDYNHPDLAANMWKNPNEVAGDGIDNDNNGYVDDIYGIDAIGGTTDPMDNFGHGTVIAGLIGAVGNNATGMAGVNWSVKLMAVKVMDAAGNVPLNAEILGITYVLQQKLAGQSVAVANCSFGRSAFIQQEFDALNQLALTGVTIVAAAGNDANNNDAVPVYPANYDIDGLISVAATDQGDALAAFSNFGRTTVDLGAPGVGILATLAAQASGPYQPYQTSYTITDNGLTQNQAFVDGTSCSAALVSGAAALLKSLKPGASTAQVKNAILNGADRVPRLNGLVATGGRLNLKNSVDQILATNAVVPVATFVTGQNLRYLEGNVGYAMAEVRVRLDRPVEPGKSCSVYYTTQPGGSAIPGVDYVATSGYLTFSGAETQKSFYVQLIGDRRAEEAEQFAVQIVAAKSKGVTTGGGGMQQVNIVILDDDNTVAPVQPGPTGPGLRPQVSIDVKRQVDPANPGPAIPVPILEGGLATFVVSLDKTSTVPVSVRYRTNQPSLVPVGTALEGVDYVATSGTITFKPGERTKEFTVKILADRETESDETFRVVLTEPINADLAGAAGPGTSAGVTATIANVVPTPPGFQILVTFPDNSLTRSQQLVFEQAAARWSQIITADLPDVFDPATGRTIDDLWIEATAPAIDGVGGILGGAGPTEFRAGPKGLPWKGQMVFDSADVPLLQNDGSFSSVILHEMGHVLGIGTLWSQFGFLVNPGTSNPTYVGANALREYRTIFSVPAATSVPVENTGGQGTADGHWRESVFRTELMTGYAESAGTAMPISRITVGSLQDLGYTVNYARADPYMRPALQSGTPAPRPTSPVAPVGNRRWLMAAASQVALSAPVARDTAAVASAFARMASEQPASRPARPAVRRFAVAAAG